jgi:glycosyltransferase involved in cell wall biosynthesis
MTTDFAVIVNRLGENWLGGVNYYRNLLAVFDAAAEPGLRLHLLTDDFSFLNDLRLSSRVHVHQVPMLQRRSTAWALRQSLLLATGKDVQLVSYLKRLKIQAVLFKYVPGSAAAGIPSFPWIPDFQSQHHPELFPASLVEAERKNAARYVQQAAGLIVSSQAARDDAMTLFGADAAKLHVLPFAPKLDFEPLQSAALRDEVLARHGVTRPFVFLPNQYWQHKNHFVVAQALSLLREQGAETPLVLSTGKTDDFRNAAHFPAFEAFVRKQGLEECYRILGVIPRQDMLVLLAHSAAVLNPSRFEGWSTTVEEAKALGKPLLVSDIPVHREQVKGQADVSVFGANDAPGLALKLGALQQRLANNSIAAYAPRPDVSLYAGFSQRYIGLIKRLAAQLHADA